MLNILENVFDFEEDKENYHKVFLAPLFELISNPKKSDSQKNHASHCLHELVKRMLELDANTIPIDLLNSTAFMFFNSEVKAR
jgi:hypothetical protein